MRTLYQDRGFSVAQVSAREDWNDERTLVDVTVAVLEGLDALLGEAGVRLADVDAVLHATTVATNAIIERKGAKTALIATEGFRDVIEIADDGFEFAARLEELNEEFVTLSAKGEALAESIQQTFAELVVHTPLDTFASPVRLSPSTQFQYRQEPGPEAGKPFIRLMTS